jgi:cholesterol transport system auxiliary component
MTRFLVLACVLMACAGCFSPGGGEKREPPATYRLTPPAVETGSSGPANATLGVARPRTAPALDSPAIAVVRPGQSFDYYSGVRWVEPVPAMLQQLLVQTLASSGTYATVVSSPSRVNVEHLLDVELRRFEAVADSDASAPRVYVQMQVTLIDARRGKRLASAVAAADKTATANRRDAVIDAFEQATSAALLEVVARVREAASTAATETPSSVDAEPPSSASR